MLREIGFRRPLPSSALILMAIFSTQLSAVLAKQLFDAVGYTGAVSINVIFAAIVLLLWRKPRLQESTWKEKTLVIAMGLVLVGMYLCLYAAIERIPLGIVIAFQFVGPLGFSVAKSCRRLDLLWVFLAAVGITITSSLGRLPIHPVGVSLALLSGLFLATYIALATRVGGSFRQGGLALAITVSAIALLPAGVNASRALVMDPHLFLVGLWVAIFSAVIPFSLDAIVLQRTSAKPLVCC